MCSFLSESWPAYMRGGHISVFQQIRSNKYYLMIATTDDKCHYLVWYFYHSCEVTLLCVIWLCWTHSKTLGSHRQLQLRLLHRQGRQPAQQQLYISYLNNYGHNRLARYTVHHITLHWITLHCIAAHYSIVHWITVHYITSSTLHY